VAHTPEHAILEDLAGVRPQWLGAGPPPRFRPVPETFRVVKKRETSAGQLWYVACHMDEGRGQPRPWHWVVSVAKETPRRWKASGVTGGSGDFPARRFPWANLGGSWGPRGLRAGGTVEDAGKGVARVTLIDAKGRVFEDTVDDGIVLFLSDEPVAMPMRVHLYDRQGGIVATDEWGFEDD
jgi:hypothetical protein